MLLPGKPHLPPMNCSLSLIGEGPPAWPSVHARAQSRLTNEKSRAQPPNAGDEASPSIAGHTVVYQKVEGDDQDICAYNMTTGAVRCLDLPGVQRNPNVSGSTVTFEDLS